MEWYRNSLLKEEDFQSLDKEIKILCQKYNVDLPDWMKISKRLRSTDGIYSLFGNGEYPVSEIKLAYKHYKKFGIESFIRVLRHEVLHHVCYEKGYGTDHNETFKDMCLENNACLNDIFAKGKYESLVYEGIRTDYK